MKIPYGENALAMLGSDWIKEYGVGEHIKENKKMHFHNLMEIAICKKAQSLGCGGCCAGSW